MSELADETVELVRAMIRNRCVNDGTAKSGHERRNVDVLASFLEGSGLDVQRIDSSPDRANLVVRIEGRDPDAPSLCLLGHTDVVPVNEAQWENDPFGGELIDGFVWGRGAIDMFNLTASMAVAVKHLARSGFRPAGTLVYAAVADEEARGDHGAGLLVRQHSDAVRCDYLVTESGGFPLPGAAGLRLPFLAEEKGPLWATLRVTGTPGHGSMPFRSDNALVKAAEVVARLAAYCPPTRVDGAWRAFVEGLGVPEQIAASLLDEDALVDALELLPLGISRMAYSCTHTTITPTMLRAGSKQNVIPDDVELALDVRVLPGDDADVVRAMIRDALGDLADEVELRLDNPHDLATSSPADSPLRNTMQRASRHFYPDATLLPMRMVGTTDARHFRRAFGTVAYGFGMFSPRLSLDDLAAMGHGHNERVDVESLAMVTTLWDVLVRDFLG